MTVGCRVSSELEGKEGEKTLEEEVECGLQGTTR